MFRIDSAGAVVAPPAAEAVGSTVGYFTEGDPISATPATVVSADWLNSVQEELLAFLTEAGITPNKTDRDQVLESVKSIFQNDASIANMSIGNNQASQNITGLVFDKTIYKSAIIEYDIYRKTDAPTELSAVGRLVAIYKPVANTWTLVGPNDSGDDCEVTFDITSAGQIRYTSSNLAGANYAGLMRLKVKRFKI